MNNDEKDWLDKANCRLKKYCAVKLVNINGLGIGQAHFMKQGENTRHFSGEMNRHLENNIV